MAAEELSVSPSAMSRMLGRLRRVVGDPLLVPSGRGLTLTGRARELRPAVESALVAALACESDALALVPAGFAHRAAEVVPLTVLDIPLELPPVRVGMAWHLRADADPVHRWLRATVARIARDNREARAGAAAVAG
jgi:DNA-binding transcriptional LysR family regulator